MEPLALFTYLCTENSHCRRMFISISNGLDTSHGRQICYIEDNQLLLKAYIAHISRIYRSTVLVFTELGYVSSIL